MKNLIYLILLWPALAMSQLPINYSMDVKGYILADSLKVKKLDIESPTGVKKFEVDQTGLIKTVFTPHAQSIFKDSAISIALTQNQWFQITRPISKTTWPTTEFYGFTDSGDTISAQYSGHYIINYDINISGLDNKTYEYRIMKKNGTSSEIWKFKVAGTGTDVLRSINSYIDLSLGAKFWIEMRSTSNSPGSIILYGGRMAIHPVHINF